MKELREYQQSEAYKMCTEKIQEKKIKKGGLWEQRLPASLPEPLGGMLGWLLGVTSFLLSRGCGLCGSEHPAERAPTQGKARAGLPVWGETEALQGSARGNHAGCRFGQRETPGLCFKAPVSRRSRARSGRRQRAAVLPVCPGRATPLSLCLLSVQPQGDRIPFGGTLPDPSPPLPQAGECSDTFSTFDVPIFTEEFLDQNKGEGLGEGCSRRWCCRSSLHPAGQDHGGRWVRDPGSERSLDLDRGAGGADEPL